MPICDSLWEAYTRDSRTSEGKWRVLEWETLTFNVFKRRIHPQENVLPARTVRDYWRLMGNSDGVTLSCLKIHRDFWFLCTILCLQGVSYRVGFCPPATQVIAENPGGVCWTYNSTTSKLDKEQTHSLWWKLLKCYHKKQSNNRTAMCDSSRTQLLKNRHSNYVLIRAWSDSLRGGLVTTAHASMKAINR